jgi:DNA primase
MEILSTHLNMFTNVIVLFDNDEPGIIASNKLVEYINGHYKDKAMNIVLPFEEKDPADIIKAGKKQELINFLK